MIPQPMPVRILVVDDDAMSRELLAMLLQREGYEVGHAESGDAALALLSRYPAAPHVVLTDVQMPGISGSQLADAFRRICGPETLLLAMSGSGSAAEEIAPFDGFLMKPFTVQQFVATLSTHCNKPVQTKGADTHIDRKSRTNASQTEPASTKIPTPSADATPFNGSMELGANDSTTAGVRMELEAGVAVLNDRIYAQLAASMPGPQLHQLYAMCVNDARDRIASMRLLAAKGDGAHFARQAHAIKGGCGMLGATELYAISSLLESAGIAAKKLDAPLAANSLDKLAAACDRLERILESRALASHPG